MLNLALLFIYEAMATRWDFVLNMTGDMAGE